MGSVKLVQVLQKRMATWALNMWRLQGEGGRLQVWVAVTESIETREVT
jgi:hypothetical protein